MNNNNKNCQANLRRGLLASAILTGLGIAPVHAVEIDTGNEDWAVRFDNTFKFNYAQRVESANRNWPIHGITTTVTATSHRAVQCPSAWTCSLNWM